MYLQNEKGITLIEVLLSIVLLTLILATVMNFFPQMAVTNKKNVEKNQAVNLAKGELIYWQGALENNLKDFHENPSNLQKYKRPCSAEENYSCNIFELQNDDENLDVKVTVNKKSDLKNGTTGAYNIHIEIINEDENTIISETYGYILSEERYE